MAQYTTSFRVPEGMLIKIVGEETIKRISIGTSTFMCEPIKDDRLFVVGYLGYLTVNTKGELEGLQKSLTNYEIDYYTRVTK